MRWSPALLFAALAATAPLASVYLREWFAVDECLDAGGGYDYTAARCDYRDRHPMIPFRDRQRGLVLGTGIAMLTLGAGVGLLVRRGQRR